MNRIQRIIEELLKDPQTTDQQRITKQRRKPNNSTISGHDYTVRPKDTVWRIARQYGTTPTIILRANNLRTSVIYPGQTLKIPGFGDSGQ